MNLLPTPITGVSEEGPCLVIAVDRDGGLVVLENGSPKWVSYDVLLFDWRYDWGERAWVDFGPYEENDGNDEEEASDDGGPSLPGYLPDADGTGGSDQGDRVDGAAWGLDPGKAQGGED